MIGREIPDRWDYAVVPPVVFLLADQKTDSATEEATLRDRTIVASNIRTVVLLACQDAACQKQYDRIGKKEENPVG